MKTTTLSYGGQDPNTVVVDERGRVLRCVPESTNSRWRGLREFIQSDTFRGLMDAGLVIRHAQEPVVEDGVCYFEAERIAHFSKYPFWTWRQRMAALRHICRLNQALEKTDWRATDCHLENVTFRFTEPVYADIGSFSQDDRELVVSAFKWYTTDKVGLVLNGETWDSLLLELDALAPPPYRRTEWTDYQQSQPGDEHALVIGWAVAHHPATITDAGCNRGRWTRLFATGTRASVLALDCDEQCVDYCVRVARLLGLRITPLCVDLFACPVGLPVSEMAVFSSLLHHWYRAVPSWPKIAAMMDRLATRLMAVEWVSGSDPDVARWTNLAREEYKLDRLMDALPEWEVIESANPESKHRTWMLLRRK